MTNAQALAGQTTAYDAKHRRARLYYLANLQQNPGLPCWRCGKPMYYEDRRFLDLGHDEHDRTKYRGLECRRCNRSAGAVNSNRPRVTRPSTPAYVDGRGRW